MMEGIIPRQSLDPGHPFLTLFGIHPLQDPRTRKKPTADWPGIQAGRLKTATFLSTGRFADIHHSYEIRVD